MAKGDTVDITVKINDQFSQTIERLKKQLGSVEDIIEVILKINSSDINRVKAELEALDKTVTESDHIINKKGGDRPPPGADYVASNKQGRGPGGRFRPKGIVQNVNNIGDNLPVLHRTQKAVKRQRSGSISRVTGGNFSNQGLLSRSIRNLSNIDLSKKFEDIEDAMDGIDEKVKRLIPSMVAWFNLIAAFIPAIITWATALLGIASAMGAVIAAGAGLGLMGFLGMDDPMGRLEEFAGNLKDIFRPVMNAFQPIVESMLQATKMDLSVFAQSMRDIAVFSEIVQGTISGVIGWFRRLMEISVSLEHIISQLTDRFGSFIGGGLLDFFEWLVEEAYRNQEAFISLTQIFGKLLAALYNASEAVSYLLIEFENGIPIFGSIFDILVLISEIINNEVIRGILAMAAKMYVLAKALTAVYGMLQLINSALMKTGLGILAVLAGYAAESMFMDTGRNGFGNGGPGGASGVGMGTSSRGGDTYYTMNVDGNTTDRHVQKFKDIEAGHRAVESKDDKRSRGN